MYKLFINIRRYFNIAPVKSFEYWSKKELEALPKRKWNEEIGEFDSLIILPTKHIHDSGFRCMDFVAVKRKKPFCRLSGCSDVIHIDGIGGYGEWKGNLPTVIPPKGWSIDCLKKSGLLRIFSCGKLKAGSVTSSFELYSLNKFSNNFKKQIIMAKVLKKEYWMCIIGSTTRDKLPDGADFPMRMSVRETYAKLTGQYDEHCWSGWGLTDKKRDLIMKIWNMDEADLPNEIAKHQNETTTVIQNSMNGAEFLRDVVEFMNSRNENLNQNKTVRQLISDFMQSENPDPNHYHKDGHSCIGF